MKLKYLFPIFIAILALMTSCNDEDTVTLLDEIQVSSSYVSIPVDGGSTTITIMAKDSWTLENTVEWLSLSSTSGSAGESTLTFSAESALDGRTAEILIQCGGETQRINIIQGLAVVAPATVAEILAGPESKTYQVTGVVTSITNTTYGNWYLEDETGSIYIYGTLDSKGGEKNFLSWGLEVGDEITIEGPKGSYKGTPQLVNVTVININKSLVKVDSTENAQLPIEGGEFIAYVTCKGEGLSVEIPADAESWLSISSIQTVGTNSVVTFKAEANEAGDRETTITFSTTDGTKNYTSQTSLSQKGAILEVSIADFLAAEVGNTLYRLSGVITEISNTTYGNLYLRDYSGETYVYGIEDFQDKNLKQGDIITIVGKRGEYKGNPQVVDAVLEEAKPVTPATIAEVLTKPDDSNVYFMVTGTIASITSETYGNLYLQDDSGEIYAYGCYPGYGASGDDKKGLIAAKDIKVGDTLTMIAAKGSYNESPQLSHGFYFSHVSAQ
ncbi:Putative binding domain-containing protein, N-terminal [Draconibacterium orientale]|uniref:DNA-binding protein n=1 Tax=Draconibacterium orientale TaxID=1168034 RepID=X5DZ75_9BACT|nr:BACON domain-containing carbohydrate-binding protein [Draconibacterium orientale]AHW59611.1 DNA-binding protein [Draconibacterium orientale]SES82799.1 Putative binding domain-containing protein, N-terminal [Draconibacterium orientale]